MSKMGFSGYIALIWPPRWGSTSITATRKPRKPAQYAPYRPDGPAPMIRMSVSATAASSAATGSSLRTLMAQERRQAAITVQWNRSACRDSAAEPFGRRTPDTRKRPRTRRSGTQGPCGPECHRSRARTRRAVIRRASPPPSP
ncbi:hypothetical protein SVIO_100310 [Streptomyces violaceusniger]|uniref:Uncharacterized protein n=1 Tax=Streptomyces violaceusniger TaxID=68280 RepID=A0A4D4LLU1_STRVO|nr:hypothetical protein SVIO_100310 [Streptomyces violaceusniger]